MNLSKTQRENLGKYFLDMSKIITGVYVLTSLPNKPLLFTLGLFSSLVLLGMGLNILKGVEK